MNYRFMINKELYQLFCDTVYVPVFSKPWWMDAVCGKDNWGVWVYEKGGVIWAAMPFFFDTSEGLRCIRKATLTQNNGIIIKYPENQKNDKIQSWEEAICQEAIDFISDMNLDIYEQQFSTECQNMLPFFWNYYSMTPRYTYVIEDTSNLENVEKGFSSKLRNIIRKGENNIASIEEIDEEEFYREHEKIFTKQGLNCPFSFELWRRLNHASLENNSGKMLVAKGFHGEVSSLAYFVNDKKKMYLLLGGAIPEYSSMQTYSVLIKKGIEIASKKGLQFDFEGSVIRRINHSIREFGATPKLYYKVRKVFNPEIIRKEAEEQIERLKHVLPGGNKG